MRLAIITNIPAPYRVPVYNLIGAGKDVELHVFYAIEREPDRQWDLPPLKHKHTFLTGRMYVRGQRYIHDNIEVYDKLGKFRPDVVVTTGYNPTHLYAFAWAWLHRCPHVVMTDGTEDSEAGLSELHRIVRRFVFRRSGAFVVASNGGRRLLESYDIASRSIHASPLCANSEADWRPEGREPPDIDFLFSGRLVKVKNPQFVLEVARGAAAALGRRVRVAFLGSGPLEANLRDEAARSTETVDTVFAGHVSQGDLPGWFYRARIFLFPTSWDPWGVVANEAFMAGVPAIISRHAGAAGELVRDGVNGYVLPLDAGSWTAAALLLLTEPALRARMSANARQAVKAYSFEAAAQGIVDAATQALAPRVVCIQRRLTHYRVPLFELVRNRLAEHGVRFDLVFGEPTRVERAKKDEGRLEWGTHVPCHYFFGGRLCWQNSGQAIKGADLVIVTQENKLLFNYVAMTVRRPKRLAFWGHGRNFQANAGSSWRERFKAMVSVHVDWWFAYTGLSQRLVKDMGFRNTRITNLENAIDTEALAALCEQVTASDIVRLRKELDLGEGPLGIFVGSLYTEKRLDFLLEAASRLAALVPGFHLLVVGDGPQRGLVEAALSSQAWVRYVGAKFDRDKAVCMRAATLMLNPGLVGLGILDAFVAGVPIVTTDCNLHSPEVDYLRSGENGLMTDDSIGAYVQACHALLTDDERRGQLSRAARLDAAHYTLENMAARLCDGVLSALKVAPR